MNLVDVGLIGIGASGVKNTLQNNILRGAVQTGVAAGLTQYLNKDWRLAGIPVSIGMASAGWSDLGSLNIKSGVAKILFASAIANGNKMAVEERTPTLNEVGVVSAVVAGAGLAHAVGSKVLGFISPYLIKACWNDFKGLVQGAYEDCKKIGQRPQEQVRYGSSVRYT